MELVSYAPSHKDKKEITEERETSYPYEPHFLNELALFRIRRKKLCANIAFFYALAIFLFYKDR